MQTELILMSGNYIVYLHWEMSKVDNLGNCTHLRYAPALLLTLVVIGSSNRCNHSL